MPKGFCFCALSKSNRTMDEKLRESPVLIEALPANSCDPEGMGWVAPSAEKTREYRMMDMIIPAKTKLMIR